MSLQTRRWLKESLRKHIVMAFLDQGFELVPLTAAEAQGREFRTAFPFGTLRRQVENGFELVEVQLDKAGGAAFRLNIGLAPAGGIDHPTGHFALEDIRVHYLPCYLEAYSWPNLRRWFGLFRIFGAPTQSDYDRYIVDRHALVDEVELALRTGSQGPHIRLVRI